VSAERGARSRSRVPDLLVTTAAWAWRLLVLALVAYLVARLLALLSVVTVPLILALLVTALLTPVRDFLQRAGLHRVPASWATFLLAVVALGGMLTFAVYQADRNAGRLLDESSATLDKIGNLLSELPLGLGSQPLAALQARFGDWVTAHRSELVSTLYTGANVTLHLLVSLLIAAVLTFLLLYDGDRIWDRISGFSGPRWSRRLHDAGTAAWETLSGYVHATLLIATFHGVVIGTTLAVLHVPLAVVLAVFVFVGSFVPIAGALVAGGLAVLVALATGGLVDGGIVLGMLLLANQVESHLLQPLLMRRFVHVHPIVTVIGIAALASVWGIPGALVAVPTAAVVHRVWPVLTGPDPVGIPEPVGHPEAAGTQEPGEASRTAPGDGDRSA
jgi:predicted PurR-regulated permease PerM